MGSNALSFKEWAINENIVTTTPLEQFKGRRIGIDAEDYLHSLLVTGNREPLLQALGGQPFSLNVRINEDLENYQAAGIEPVFVFNGLDLACRDRTSVLNESKKAMAVLNDAWHIYDQGKGDEAVNAFGRACTYRSYHIARSLQVYIHRRGVRVQTAPYDAAAQLAYMERENVVDGVKGSASCLVFGSDRVILNFDWEKQEVVWVSLQKCLSKLDLNRDAFVNVCLISGSSFLSALPELDVETPLPKVLAAKGLLKSANYDVDSLLRHKDSNYYTLFHKARFAVKHPVVLTVDGEVEPINWQSGPSDVHEFIGQRLPEELYFYLSRGVTGPRMLNWRTRKEILETPPLDGGNSATYKDVVQTKLQPLRAKSLALMTVSLNRYYQKNDVDLVCWWNEQTKTPLGVPDVTTPAKAAEEWHVKLDEMPKSSEGQAEGAPLLYGILSLSQETEAKKTVTSKSSDLSALLKHEQEIRANVVWRFLQDREYINDDHTLSAWGQALKAAFDRAIHNGVMSNKDTKAEIEEALFVAFELLRLNLLNRNQMFPVPPYTGVPVRGDEDDKANTMFISRVACLGNLEHSAIGYTGPLSRQLLAYQQTVATVRGALRDLIEMHACNMLLSGAVDRGLKNTEYTDLGASLPLVSEPDVGLALLVKSYLDELSQAPDNRAEYESWFPHVHDFWGNVEKAWKMWDAINAGIQAADSSIVHSETKSTFQNADDWLKRKLQRDDAPNGTA